MNELLKQLHDQEEWFRSIIEEAYANQPELPTFTPGEDNTDDWKHKSGVRDGFLLALQFIDPYYRERGSHDGRNNTGE